MTLTSLDALLTWLSMGGYGLYVWGSLGMCVAVAIAEISGLRAQRLGALALQSARNGLTVQLQTNLQAYDLAISDVVTFPSTRYGFTGEFEVIARTMDPATNTIKLQLKQWTASQWAWSYTGATAKSDVNAEVLDAQLHELQEQVPQLDDARREAQQRLNDETAKHNIDLELGESILIADGPFKDLEGKVSEVDQERGKVKVLVSLFGRETPVELDLLQVAKL